jgi:hypothetical protein
MKLIENCAKELHRIAIKESIFEKGMDAFWHMISVNEQEMKGSYSYINANRYFVTFRHASLYLQTRYSKNFELSDIYLIVRFDIFLNEDYIGEYKSVFDTDCTTIVDDDVFFIHSVLDK